MVKTRSGSASCSSHRRPHRSSAALAPRKHKRRRRALAMKDNKKKLRRQRALQKQVSILSGERGNGGSKRDPQKHRPPQSYNSRPKTKTVAKRGVKSESPPAYCGRKTSSKQAAAPIKEESSVRNSKFSERNRHANSSRQPCETKVRILKSAEGCTTDRSCAQLTEAQHDSGWTSEQDAALQSAYFLVRPSSNFWFEVSKKVSGKTAKDCFDRFYSAHPTPPSTPPRSKKIAAESPVRTISFASPMPSLNCKGHFGRGKQGLLKAHQTVRHILRHQKVADEAYEADVFSAVERLNPRDSLLQNCVSRTPALKRHDSESPITSPASCSGHARSDEVWWSASSKLRSESDHDQKKEDSRSLRQLPLLSPEVLKAERNPSRLDRFLNILHMRRVCKRKSSSLKGTAQREECLNSDSRPMQCVAAAREAILLDAKEVLKTALKQKAGVEEEASFSSDQTEDESSLLLE